MLSAVDPDMVKNFITAGSFVPVVIAIVLFKFVLSTVVRTLMIVVAVALGVVVFTQRAAVDECVESFRTDDKSCSILGFDIDIDI